MIRKLSIVLFAVSLAACSAVLGLDDLREGSIDEGAPPPAAAPGECTFDQSKFDDGCSFAP